MSSNMSSEDLFLNERMKGIERQAKKELRALDEMTREDLIRQSRRLIELSVDRRKIIWGTRYKLFQFFTVLRFPFPVGMETTYLKYLTSTLSGITLQY